MFFIPVIKVGVNMNKPPDITRQYNNFEIGFGKGKKSEGDYVIFVNGIQFTDKDIFTILCTGIKLQKDAAGFLKFLWKLGKEKGLKEEQVYEKILHSNYGDEIKTSLYVIWHRLIIDDINYPPPSGNGRKRLLAQIYTLLAKKHNFELHCAVKSLPDEVYLLGFPKGVEEKISNESWLEIYELYEKFVDSQDGVG